MVPVCFRFYGSHGKRVALRSSILLLYLDLYYTEMVRRFGRKNLAVSYSLLTLIKELKNEKNEMKDSSAYRGNIDVQY